MLQAEMRRVAMQAARSQFRRMGTGPATVGPDEALKVLDDLMRSEPMLIASKWCEKASGAQIQLFRREWQMWRQERA